jgi:hypothetical protein
LGEIFYWCIYINDEKKSVARPNKLYIPEVEIDKDL